MTGYISQMTCQATGGGDFCQNHVIFRQLMSVKDKAVTAEETATRILVCLEEIALEKGLDALSMRDVAKRTGISLASLQYHYPSKAVLLEAFVKRAVDDFRDQTRAILEGSGDGEPIVPIVIQHALEEVTENEQGSTDLLLLIWARSLHDKTTHDNFAAYMRIYLEAMAEAVGIDYPELTASQRLLAATLIVSMLEGFTATYNMAKTLGVDSDSLLDAAKQMAEAISRHCKTTKETTESP